MPAMWLAKVIKSFRYALEGLKYTVVTQRNMRIHFLVALGVLVLSLYLPLSKLEVLLLFVAIILVIFAELINTAIEKVVDMVTEEFHPLAKIAKDVAAGAVLLTAGLAIVIGISIFYPYLNLLFLKLWKESYYPPDFGVAIVICINFFLTLFIKAGFHRLGKWKWEPSMSTSLVFGIAVILFAAIPQLWIQLLVILLLLLFLGIRLRQPGQWRSVFLGALIGSLLNILSLFILK
jgi:diacylglycerol kinase (ATP)